MFLIYSLCIIALPIITYTAEPPQTNIASKLKPRILHGYNIYPERKKTTALLKEDQTKDGYYWNPIKSLIKISKAIFKKDQSAITNSRIWGALIALKKKLPAYGIPKDIICNIALEIVSDQKIYTRRECCFIAYEFISDNCYDSTRPAWLLQLFEKVEGLEYCQAGVIAKARTLIFYSDSAERSFFYRVKKIAYDHKYHKIIPCQLGYDSDLSFNLEITMTSNYRELELLLNKVTNPANVLVYEAAISAVDKNLYFILQRLIEVHHIDLSKIKTLENKNLLHFTRTPEMVELLMTHVIDINKEDKTGLTPLLHALHSGKFYDNKTQLKTVKKLLENGAWLNTAKHDAIAYATSINCCTEVINLLEQSAHKSSF